MLAITEHGVTLVVASLSLAGVIVTAFGAVMAAAFSRSARNEVKSVNGGTFAQSVDERLAAIESRLEAIEGKRTRAKRAGD